MHAVAGALMSPAELAERLADPEAEEDFSPLGTHPIVFLSVNDASLPLVEAALPKTRLGIFVGVDLEGALPSAAAPHFDLLLTTAPDAPRPWVSLPGEALEQAISLLNEKVSACPIAATTFAQVLRFGEDIPMRDALVLESLAYSALLAGAEFRAWRTAMPKTQRPSPDRPLVKLARDDRTASLTLAFPETRNAFRARMRDEFIEGLRVLLLDPDIEKIDILGEGPSFCSGGDLGEFGSAPDVARAHAIRVQRSAALLVHNASSRLVFHLHGACVGAGIEVSAAGGTLLATTDTWLRLPEVGMGLIPGAGGTATIPRRIGRHRACYMGLTGADIGCHTARDWGLVDRIVGV